MSSELHCVEKKIRCSIREKHDSLSCDIKDLAKFETFHAKKVDCDLHEMSKKLCEIETKIDTLLTSQGTNQAALNTKLDTIITLLNDEVIVDLDAILALLQQMVAPVQQNSTKNDQKSFKLSQQNLQTQSSLFDKINMLVEFLTEKKDDDKLVPLFRKLDSILEFVQSNKSELSSKMDKNSLFLETLTKKIEQLKVQ